MAVVRGTAIASMILLAGCASSSNSRIDADASPTDAAPDTFCGPTLKPRGPACEPQLDDCPQDHVPIPGGGCQRVGVAECELDGDGVGIEGPPDWTCKPIGPPRPCLAGWSPVDGGWCEPILPAGPCSGATMAVIGETVCQPVGDCGSGTYGDIVTSDDTIYVDSSCAGKHGDGSRQRPFASISAALLAARPGGHVAVAAGSYNEALAIDRSVVLQGRCAELVRIDKPSTVAAFTPVLTIAGANTSAELSGITVAGGPGIRLREAALQLDRVVVRDAGLLGIGVDVGRNGRLAARHCLFADNAKRALEVENGTVTIARSTIRKTGPTRPFEEGAIRATSATLALQESVVIDNHVGALALASTATVERSVFSRNREGGLSVRSYRGEGSSLSVSASIFFKNNVNGIQLAGGVKAKVDGTVISTLPDSEGRWGRGIGGFGGPGGLAPQYRLPGQELTLTRSALVSNHMAGVLSNAADTTIDATLILDTRVSKGEKEGLVGGDAVNAFMGRVRISDSLIVGAEGAGLHAMRTTASIERTILRDSRPRPCIDTRNPLCLDPIESRNTPHGQGVLASAPPQNGQPTLCELTMHDSLVVNAHHDGVALAGCTAHIERTSVRGTRSHPDFEEGRGIAAYPIYSLMEPSALELTDSRVSDNSEVGVLAVSSAVAIERCGIDATRSSSGPLALGYGIAAVRFNGRSASLAVKDSLVAGSMAGGASIHASDATLQRCTIRQSHEIHQSSTSESKWGDGVSLTTWEWSLMSDRSGFEPLESNRPSTLDLEACLVEDSDRVGLLFDGSNGTVKRSVFRGGIYPIHVQRGADPTIAESNVFEDNVENEVSHSDQQTFEPSPLPGVSVPEL